MEHTDYGFIYYRLHVILNSDTKAFTEYLDAESCGLNPVEIDRAWDMECKRNGGTANTTMYDRHNTTEDFKRSTSNLH